MDKVRLGVIGVGGMGSVHTRYLQAGELPRCTLTAICDVEPKALEPYEDIKKFSNSAELIRSGDVDAVLIATPHYAHTTIGIDALEQGLHVLTEKPISVHKADCERLIAAHKNKDQVFGVMFQLRTDPSYMKLKEVIDRGDLGAIQRVNWIITTWFRSEAYYASGGWRATWRGEGGGVLLNQSPHTLDLLQWICGMPKKVYAKCDLGRHHNIEVEDDVHALLEYENGARGVFVTGTGEAPGTNRLEIIGDRGRIVLENGKINLRVLQDHAEQFRCAKPVEYRHPRAERPHGRKPCGGYETLH
jgi:predicted dehydrogenase